MYRLKMQAGRSTWYSNSVAPIIDTVNDSRPMHKFQSAKEIYALYSKTYGVKLVFGDRKDGGYLEYVEFPSEAEATMFLLRFG